MENAGAPRLYLVREPEPLGNYFRPSAQEFGYVANLLSAGFSGGTGIAVEGRSLNQPHFGELRDAALRNGMQVVVDSMGLEMMTPTGWSMPRLKEMSWVARKRFSTAPFNIEERRQLTFELARATVEARATAVLAPARFLETIERDELAHDVETAIELRRSLNEGNGQSIRIYYPLATNLQTLASTTARTGIVATLREGLASDAFDAIWVRAARYGMAAGPSNVRRYLAGIRGLHELNVPIVGDRAGTAGLGMIALGATSAITSGITSGERFEPRELFRPRPARKGGMAPRVYIPTIGAFVKRAEAEEIFKHSSKNWFLCQRDCCAERGWSATIGDPRRHFVVTRVSEVRELAEVPSGLRAEHYMDSWLRRASDRAVKAQQINSSLENHRLRLDALRSTLAAVLEEDAASPQSVTRSPVHMRARRGA